MIKIKTANFRRYPKVGLNVGDSFNLNSGSLINMYIVDNKVFFKFREKLFIIGSIKGGNELDDVKRIIYCGDGRFEPVIS